MKNMPKLVPIIIIVAIVLLGGFGVMQVMNSQKSSKSSSVTQVSPSPTPSPIASTQVSPVPASTAPSPRVGLYADWELFRNGYALPIPPKWQNTSDIGGTAVLEPGKHGGEQVGSIQKISITVLSDKKAPAGQQFTTQREFDEWSAVKTPVQGNIQKLENVMVDGQKGVMLLDAKGGENNWAVIVWVRKDAINLYLTIRGNQKYGAIDAQAIDYMTSHFTFTAPPSTGREGKE